MIDSLRTAQLDYDLPERLIARRPAEPRDTARMLVVHADGSIAHRLVRDLPDYLSSGDGLVVNNTRVTPARILGSRADSGGQIEGLVLDTRGTHWQVMLRSNGRLREGIVINLHDHGGKQTDVTLTLLARDGAQWLALGPPADALDRIGHTPLPPYILRARREDHLEGLDEQDRRWYQTVFAHARARSVAAPTAGLHFTDDLLGRIDQRGVQRIEVTLEVGPGTFKPVTAERLSEHPMHCERFSITADAARSLAGVRQRCGHLWVVGTTTTRVLESLATLDIRQPVYESETTLLIAPGHRFRYVDALLTNFHLPRSTLLALVAAKIGLSRVMDVYAQAVDREYRFYSYGDAMLIMPGCET